MSVKENDRRRRFVWLPGDLIFASAAEVAADAAKNHPSNEGFTEGALIRDDTSFHAGIMTVEADRRVARTTAKRAVEEGMDPAVAKKLWG